MKFFVPFMGPSEAEQLWAYTRQHLSGLGLETKRRRIQALVTDGGALQVGGDVPFEDEELVMIILESSEFDLFYVCTPGRGVRDDIPYPLSLDERWQVVDFDEEACGLA